MVNSEHQSKLRWQRIRTLFEAALDLEQAERRPWLAKQCGRDEELLAKVQSLLECDGSSTQFLQPPMATEDGCAEVFDDDNHLGRRVGPYELKRVIASGGMGTVFLAVRDDGHFRKEVAVKLIKPGMDTAEILQRFRNERQVLANLEHPNIARLLDGGSTEDNRPYLVMEYVEGTPIDCYCDEHRLPIAERLELFRAVCRAVEHAHGNLVVHRDLKPQNILVSADGTVKLLDFGIAKVLSDQPAGYTKDVTATVARLMTPRYASPEQILGQPITTATDIYSLGVVLYELLTGHRPYRLETDSQDAIEWALRDDQPTRPSTSVSRTQTYSTANAATETTVTPEAVSEARRTNTRQLKRELTGDLDTIVLMALRKEPQRRYASVEQLGQDIARYLCGKPVTARPTTLRYITGKLIHRNRGAFIAGGVGAGAATVIAALLVVWFVLMPRWSVEALHQARINLIGPYLQDDIYNVIFWNLPLAHGEGTAVLSDLDRAIPYYDRAARFARGDELIMMERAAVYAAKRVIEQGGTTAPLEEIGAALGPGVAALVSSRSAGQTESLRDGMLIRQAGLLMMLVRRPWPAIDLLTRYEAISDRDPLIEWLLGELYLAVLRPALAYPRLRVAHDAFPESRFLTVALAEAAVGVGDVYRARRLLRRAEAMPSRDIRNRFARVAAMIDAATGPPERAHEAFAKIRTENAVAQYHYASALERAGLFDQAMAWYAHNSITSAPPHQWRPNAAARLMSGYVLSTERWIASWNIEERSTRIHAAMTEATARQENHGGSLVVIPWTLGDRLVYYVNARCELLERPKPFNVLPGGDAELEAQRKAWVEPTQAAQLAELLAVEDDALWSQLVADPTDELAASLIRAWIAGDAAEASAVTAKIRGIGR